MFKRANKITSLLIAAAAVVSLVPASAADVKKMDSEDGTVYNAVAYADGKAFVDGEINDDEAAYYLENGEFKALDDVDSGDDAVLYGEKYIDVEDGDYTLDLDAGTTTDDDIVGDTSDDAASALRKEIKEDTDDRYNEDETADIKEDADLVVIPGAKYGAVWYETTYAQTTGKTANKTAPNFNVYTDTKGNYIDADYNLGKIKVTTTYNAATTGTDVKDKDVTVDNTNDTYDAVGTDGKDAVSVSVAQDKVLTQDADYIYRLVDVTVNVKASAVATISAINGIELTPKKIADTPEIFDASADGKTVTYKAIQKISKAQDSDDVDGAKYAKTVTTYAVSNDSGKTVTDFSTLVNKDDTKFTVAGGKLIAYNTEDGNSVTVQAVTLKSSSGYYYTDDEDKGNEDTENSADQGGAVQVDVDGNIWRLDGGYIYKFDNTDDWDKVYKVDGSEDEFTVYDGDNIISWSEDDEVYSIVGGKSTGGDTTTPETPVVTAGWAQAADGTWSYNTTAGTKATGWLNVGGVWYYLNATGVMSTGWVNDAGTWYYLNASGAMATGWLNDNGTWYYLNASGAMLANTTVDGYVLGASGAWVK